MRSIPSNRLSCLVLIGAATWALSSASIRAQTSDPLFEPTDPNAQEDFLDPWLEPEPGLEGGTLPELEPGEAVPIDPNETLDLDTSDFARPDVLEEDTEDSDIESKLRPQSATLRALDKITAKTIDIDIGVDGVASFERLDITLRTCNKRPPEEPPEVTAFLEINENSLTGEKTRVFMGWMFASSPGLNALEHPVYDVWVIDCKMVDPETLAGSE